MRLRLALHLPLLFLSLSCGEQPQEPVSVPPSLAPLRDTVGHIRSLGTLGGPGSTATSVNNLGEVVGVSGNPSGDPHGFLWTERDGMLDLGPGAALKINDRGQVLVRRADGFHLWTREEGFVPTGIGPLHRPKDLNNLGHIVGQTAFDRAFLWTPESGLTPLEELGEGWSEAAALNDADELVGFALTDRLRGPYFLRPGQAPVLVETYPGSMLSRPVDLNGRGQVLCAALHPLGAIPFRSYVWSPDTGIVDIAQGSPAALNERGYVVGTTLQRKGAWSYGFYWEPERGITNLRWLAPRPLGSTATDLNDIGHVVGTCSRVESREAGGRVNATLWTMR